MAIFGPRVRPPVEIERSGVAATAGEKLLPASRELATETRPPAIQASHSVPSDANAAVTLVAQRSSGSSQARLRAVLVLHLREAPPCQSDKQRQPRSMSFGACCLPVII